MPDAPLATDSTAFLDLGEGVALASKDGVLTFTTDQGEIRLDPAKIAAALPHLHRFAQSGTIQERRNERGQILWQSPDHERLSTWFRNGILTVVDERGVLHMKSAEDLAYLMASDPVETAAIHPPSGEEAFHYGDAHAAMCAILGVDHLKGVRYGWDGLYAFTHRAVFREDDQAAKAKAVAGVLSRYVLLDTTQVVIETGAIMINIAVPPPPTTARPENAVPAGTGATNR